MTRKLTMILLGILILCTVGFLYTFLQPRYTATIVSIGRTRTVSSSGKHGRKSHKVVPMVVTFTDHAGVEQTVDATYRWASETLTVGQQIEIVQSFNGWIRYPFVGLRTFCGLVGGGVGLYLFFVLLDRVRRKRIQTRKLTMNTILCFLCLSIIGWVGWGTVLGFTLIL